MHHSAALRLDRCTEQRDWKSSESEPHETEPVTGTAANTNQPWRPAKRRRAGRLKVRAIQNIHLCSKGFSSAVFRDGRTPSVWRSFIDFVHFLLTWITGRVNWASSDAVFNMKQVTFNSSCLFTLGWMNKIIADACKRNNAAHANGTMWGTNDTSKALWWDRCKVTPVAKWI